MSITVLNYSRKTGFINMNKALTSPLKPETSAWSHEYEKAPQNQYFAAFLPQI